MMKTTARMRNVMAAAFISGTWPHVATVFAARPACAECLCGEAGRVRRSCWRGRPGLELHTETSLATLTPLSRSRPGSTEQVLWRLTCQVRGHRCRGTGCKCCLTLVTTRAGVVCSSRTDFWRRMYPRLASLSHLTSA